MVCTFYMVYDYAYLPSVSDGCNSFHCSYFYLFANTRPDLMETLPSEVLEDLLLKSAIAIFAESKKVEPLVDITGATMVVLMSVCDAWSRALTGRWYQATGRQGNRRLLRREFGQLIIRNYAKIRQFAT